MTLTVMFSAPGINRLSGAESWTAAALKKALEELGWDMRADMGG